MSPVRRAGRERDSHQFLVFLAVGLLSAVIDIGIMQILLLGGAHFSIAVSMGFIIALVVNYIGHSRLTFRAKTSLGGMSSFLVVVLLNYLITLGCTSLSFHLLDVVLLGKLISLPIVAINGYLLSRYWVFK